MKKRYLLLSVLVMLGSAACVAWLQPRLPASIPVHWNAAGEADGFAGRAGLFVYTGLMALVIGLWWLMPRCSPRHYTVERFAPTWWYGCLALVCFIAYAQGIHAWAACDGGVDTARAMLVGMALLFAFTGNVMGKVRRNFWFGVRTPWALASERVWYATHRLAARTMVAGAALALLLLLAQAPHRLTVGVLALALLLPAAWSLVYYKRLERSGRLEA